MLTRNALFLLFFFAKFHNYEGCSSSKKDLPTPKAYDLNNPTVINLASDLNEISGLSYYAKDTSVFAIIDEDGLLFKIFFKRNPVAIEKWQFDKKRDFEDVVLHDSTFYILVSNGDIETVKFNGKTPVIANKSQYPDADKKNNEFETLYYDDNYKQLVMVCKKCDEDKKGAVTALGISKDSTNYSPLFTINVKAIDEKLGEQKIHFKPSAAAINPVTNDLYILASVNKLLVIADRNGNMKEVYELNPDVYNQPEGITFTNDGTMLISNEKGESNSATILMFTYKKTN